jgi:hypothetical protein
MRFEHSRAAMMAHVNRRRMSHANHGERDRGAVLVLALLFVVAVGLVVTALATWATNDLNNSKTFTSVEALHSDATGMMKMSVQYVRYNPIISSNQASGVASPVTACWGGSDPTKLPLMDNVQVAVWCSTVWNPGSANTRTVTFYACPESPEAVPASVCTTSGKALLTEVVIFDDYPSGVNAPIQALCTINCGSGITVVSSTWGPSTVDVVAAAPSTISFVQEPSPTSVGVATTAYVQVEGGSSLPISNETVTLSAASGGTLSSASTLTAVTNTSGIAVFNNVIPSSAGSIVLQAADGALNTTSTAFQVSKGANTVTLSAAPTNPQVGSQVTVTATAISNDPIVTSGSPGIIVSSSTTTVCTASGGTINLVGVGPCTLTFNDSGNSNYVAASASMTFSVAAAGPSKIAVTATSTSVGASSVTNDKVTLTLQTAGGVNTVSTGTTTVSLAQSGNGYFASSNGSVSTITSVTFANGVGSVSVYFGDTTAQSVNVTASSGSLTPGSASITVTPGAANSVGVSAATPVVASSVANDSVAIVLQDQYGNSVTPTIATTLTLASTGYFAASSGSAGPLSSVTLAAGGSGKATVYFGDTNAETATLTATGSGGVTGSTFVTVSAATPSQVAISTSNTTSASSSSNLAVSLSLEDQYGNSVTPTTATTLTLASTGSGYFTSSNGGTTHITTATILGNVSTATVYFGDAVVQSPTITVSSSGLTSATATIAVTTAGPSAVKVVANSATLTATNQGTDKITLTLVDGNGNQINATSKVTLNLADSGGGFFTATSNSQTPITTVSINGGSSSATVYFGDTNAEGDSLLVSGPYSGTTSVTVVAGPTSQIAMTLSPSTVVGGTVTVASSNSTNILVDVQAEDQYGNSTTSAPSSTYYILDTGNGFYSSQSGISSRNASSYARFSLSGGQATVYFGDSSSGDNPTIQIYNSSFQVVTNLQIAVQ